MTDKIDIFIERAMQTMSPEAQDDLKNHHRMFHDLIEHSLIEYGDATLFEENGRVKVLRPNEMEIIYGDAEE